MENSLEPADAPAPYPPPPKRARRVSLITREQLFTSVALASVFGALLGSAAGVLSNAGSRADTARPAASPPVALRVAPGQALSPQAVYRRSAPGTVYVQVLDATGGASGSGIVLDRSGLILTNDHVVQGASSVEVSFENDRHVTAEIVGTDPSTDLALLKVSTAHLVLHPLTLGNSDSVVVGDPVLALGAPFGLNRTLTTGIVSALGRTIKSPNGFPIAQALQTDAAINPGNSGGPLLDAAGRVIGINSQIETQSGQNAGIGFSIPVNLIRRTLPALRRGGVLRHAWLGIAGANTSDLPSALRGALPGAYVEQVIAGGPAAAAGLRAGTRTVTTARGVFRAGGDVIVAADGHPVSSFTGLQADVAAARPGARLKLTFVRAGVRLQTTVVLGAQPLTAPAAAK